MKTADMVGTPKSVWKSVQEKQLENPSDMQKQPRNTMLCIPMPKNVLFDKQHPKNYPVDAETLQNMQRLAETVFWCFLSLYININSKMKPLFAGRYETTI